MTMAATTTATTQPATPQLTSTTAPGKVFESRKELADHYKSDWHKYNLKRREAGLPLLLETDFRARLAAALSLRQEEERNGTSHLKKGKKQRKPKNNSNSGSNDSSNAGVVFKSQAAAYDKMKQKSEDSAGGGDNMEECEDPASSAMVAPTKMDDSGETEKAAAEEENVVIDPKQCLFDRHFSATVDANADRMYRKYGYFIPDREYLTDLEGLIGFCHEKIKLGHMCLYCHKVFPSWQGCQKHMISKRHTKMRYEAGIDLEDVSIFYDFAEADKEFLQSIGATPREIENDDVVAEDEEIVEDDGDANWDDISDDEEMAEAAAGPAEDEDDDDEDELYHEYEQHLAQFGFDVNALGELVLPNGRVIGHRALSRYYRQRAPTRNESTAIVAARRAAGERLFNGQVYNIHGSDENALALTKVGINPNVAAGRAAKGILVKGSGGVYTSVSIYRFRAVVRKQHREDRQGKRLHDKSKQNINRMDKKHNRLMNGVSVAHAAR